MKALVGSNSHYYPKFGQARHRNPSEHELTCATILTGDVERL